MSRGWRVGGERKKGHMVEQQEPDNVTDLEIAAARRVLRRARAALARVGAGHDGQAEQAAETDELLRIVATWRRERTGAVPAPARPYSPQRPRCRPDSYWAWASVSAALRIAR